MHARHLFAYFFPGSHSFDEIQAPGSPLFVSIIMPYRLSFPGPNDRRRASKKAPNGPAVLLEFAFLRAVG